MYDESGKCFAFPHKVLWSTESEKRSRIFNLLSFRKAFKSKNYCVYIRFSETKVQYESPNKNNYNSNCNTNNNTITFVIRTVHFGMKLYND
jgi:hypothetical protein